MAPAREENPYEGGGDGGFGKFRKRPFRRSQTTPYDRPPTALRNPNRNNGWLSKLVDPAQRLIASSAHKLFASVFRKRLPPPQGFSLSLSLSLKYFSIHCNRKWLLYNFRFSIFNFVNIILTVLLLIIDNVNVFNFESN